MRVLVNRVAGGLLGGAVVAIAVAMNTTGDNMYSAVALSDVTPFVVGGLAGLFVATIE